MCEFQAVSPTSVVRPPLHAALTDCVDGVGGPRPGPALPRPVHVPVGVSHHLLQAGTLQTQHMSHIVTLCISVIGPKNEAMFHLGICPAVMQ